MLKAPFWSERGGLVRPWWKDGLTEEYLEMWEGYEKSPVALSAIQWRRIVEIADMEKNLIPGKHYMEIRYEDFINDPHKIVNILMKKCDLHMCRDIHRYLETVGKLKNMNYKYKKNLSHREIKIVEAITGPIAIKKGYDF
jgi:hypothetical protein